MPLTAGDRVGSYEVTAKIGEGGEVYEATDSKLKPEHRRPDPLTVETERYGCVRVPLVSA